MGVTYSNLDNKSTMKYKNTIVISNEPVFMFTTFVNVKKNVFVI